MNFQKGMSLTALPKLCKLMSAVPLLNQSISYSVFLSSCCIHLFLALLSFLDSLVFTGCVQNTTVSISSTYTSFWSTASKIVPQRGCDACKLTDFLSCSLKKLSHDLASLWRLLPTHSPTFCKLFKYILYSIFLLKHIKRQHGLIIS